MLPFVLIFAVVGLLVLEARHINLRSIQHELAAVPPLHLFLLGLGGLIASAAIGTYDLLAARVIGYRRGIGAGLRVGLMASGINNVVSLSGLTGSGLRVLLVTGDGVDSGAAVRYAGLVATASALGLSTLALITLITRPAILAATPVPVWLVMTALVVIACYLPLYLLLAMTPLLRIGRLAAIERLTPLQTVGFVCASIGEWLLAAAVLWGCVEALGVSLTPAAVAAAFVLAATLGMLSFLPGGLGVFDATLVGLLAAHGAATETAVAALVLFRFAYYLVPLIAALFLGANALARSRLAATLRAHPLVSVLAWPVGQAVDLGLRLLSALTAGAGIVLLAGAAFPNLLSRTRILSHWVPLPAVEITHLASVVIGLTLIMTARGLSLRLRQSLWLSIGLLIAGALFGLTRGLDWGTSLLLLVVASLLYMSRATFDRHGSLAQQVGAWPWTGTLLAALVGYLLLGHALYQGHAVDPLHFGFGAHAPRFERGAFVALISVIVLVIWTWPRWPTPQLARPAPADLDALVAWLTSHGSTPYSHLMLLGDKTLFYGADGQAMIGYRAIRNRLIALSDPAGDTAARRTAIGEFRQLADDMQCTPVFYQVGPDDLSAYLDHGFVLFKLGEIARVDLAAFSMTGKRNEDKRGAINRGHRLGLTFEITAPPFSTGFMNQLAAVSDDWLGEKAAEKTFSLGNFDRDYLARAPIAVVRDANGRLLAFASILPSYGHLEEYSIDLMRHLETAPGGTMDFLFVRLMQEAQAAGYRWFSLGMAPLAGVGDTPWARPAEQLARLAYEHGNRFYNYKGLRAFKNKWHPVWHSMYLAYPPDTRLSSLQLDIAALIAGGYRRILTDS
ncbi:bifunctional lysylphosphatidylglycerol flippase/synthetase MprF [Salinisphaera sp. Q1T1-3]|uniref:bifunctional lysylphosphatidylglycerol flippase/synthetase MprF n=1 Tax=Salinisphaera sp. Q1T1-3 TaxID=2321229 RepID=UPI001314076F|nr:bifunctional lysylphosphatidylglycerol flippase/synthetase MprF [Salinisphaera sp. Q1T1-3]